MCIIRRNWDTEMQKTDSTKLVMPERAPDELHDRAKRALAKLSPARFARIVSLRNSSLMTGLKLLRKTAQACGRPFWGSFETKIRCPHCVQKDEVYRCSECLWTRAAMASGISAMVMACKSVRFGGLTLNDVSSGHRYCKILYRSDKAVVILSIPSKVKGPDADGVVDKEFEECKRFLKDHLCWSQDPLWGRKR